MKRDDTVYLQHILDAIAKVQIYLLEKEDLKPYKRGKGSVRFPLDQPLPGDLIRRIVEFRVAENIGKAWS